MKKIGIRLLLVCVLVATFLLGIVGSAYAAKPYIEIDVGSFRLHDDDKDGYYQLYGTATLHGQRVKYFVAEWFSDHSGAWASLGVQKVTLASAIKTGIIGFRSNDGLAPSFCGDDFYVKVYVTNGRFKLNERKSYTSAVATLTCD